MDRDNKPENNESLVPNFWAVWATEIPYICPTCRQPRTVTMEQLMQGAAKPCSCGWTPPPILPPEPKKESAECQGHPAGTAGAMGETTYCDGSCRVDAGVARAADRMRTLLLGLPPGALAPKLSVWEERDMLKARLEELELQLARALEDIATQRRVYEERLHRVRCERDRLAWRRGQKAMRPEVVS